MMEGIRIEKIMEEFSNHLSNYDSGADNRGLWRDYLSKLPNNKKSTIISEISNYFEISIEEVAENYKEWRTDRLIVKHNEERL